MVAHDVASDKNYILRGAAAMTVDFSKLGTISGKNFVEPLDDPVYVCGSEMALSVGQLIDFWRLGSSSDGLHRAIIHTPACP